MVVISHRLVLTLQKDTENQAHTALVFRLGMPLSLLRKTNATEGESCRSIVNSQIVFKFVILGLTCLVGLINLRELGMMGCCFHGK